MAEPHLTCPKCYYDLTALSSPTCPECGYDVQLTHQREIPAGLPWSKWNILYVLYLPHMVIIAGVALHILGRNLDDFMIAPMLLYFFFTLPLLNILFIPIIAFQIARDIILKWCIKHRCGVPESRGQSAMAWIFFGLLLFEIVTCTALWLFLFWLVNDTGFTYLKF